MKRIAALLPALPLIMSLGCTATFHGMAEDLQNLSAGIRSTVPPEGGSDAAPSSGGRSSQGGGSSSYRGSADIRLAQERLKAAGYDPGPPDGVLGPQTQAALRKYQSAQGLPASGTLDKQTQKALGIGSGQ